ncbi:hypothetical protein MUO32_06120 [Shinella sp. CPCC 101442]|uniref:hypothetical protein n=1 Tax=Shinella sp. CPCC 101442 TaxID=2932265 RepID=UPI0021521854|nr:hypothetical protein [Shinella sp. CPCC 101442]MCR6498600.1 hypothetical protein [Shinella sp. CPCC 101442]
MATFGKKGTETGVGGKTPTASVRLSNADGPHKVSGDRSRVMVRADEPREANPTVVLIEKHWPKAVGVGMALFAAYFNVVMSGRTDPFSVVFASLLAGLFFYWVANKFRKSLDDLHAVRTNPLKSPAYLAGALVGFGYFVYSTFLAPSEVLGVEVGEQTAFKDGLQTTDMGAVALLLLKAAGSAVAGGVAFQFIAKRFFGAGNATENGG